MLRTMGNLAFVLVLAMLFSGLWFVASGDNRGIVPAVPTPTEVTTLPKMGNMAVVFPGEIGMVGKYTFHAPTDFGLGINVDSITTLEARWGVPRVREFFFTEPADGKPIFMVSDGKTVTLTGDEDVFTNTGLLLYWCSNSSVQLTLNECLVETDGLVRDWWPNLLPGVTPATWLKEPPLTLVPTKERAYGTVTAPTASP